MLNSSGGQAIILHHCPFPVSGPELRLQLDHGRPVNNWSHSIPRSKSLTSAKESDNDVTKLGIKREKKPAEYTQMPGVWKISTWMHSSRSLKKSGRKFLNSYNQMKMRAILPEALVKTLLTEKFMTMSITILINHWKIRFQTNNLEVLAKQEGVKPQSNQPQEIMKIVAEINKK